MFLLIQFIYSHFAPTPRKMPFFTWLFWREIFTHSDLFSHFQFTVFHQSLTEVKDLTPNSPIPLSPVHYSNKEILHFERSFTLHFRCQLPAIKYGLHH